MSTASPQSPDCTDSHDSTDDSVIEGLIRAKGLTAPRITPADIENNIQAEYYFTAADGIWGSVGTRPTMELGPLDLLTFCVLVLNNGFTVTGQSACASPANFDAEVGMKVARNKAIDQCWALMGYALKSRLDQAARSDAAEIRSEG